MQMESDNVEIPTSNSLFHVQSFLGCEYPPLCGVFQRLRYWQDIVYVFLSDTTVWVLGLCWSVEGKGDTVG